MLRCSTLIQLTRAATAIACTAFTVSAFAHQQHAHTHGRLSLDVAIDTQTITLLIASPLDSFLGFERAPRTDTEHKRVHELVTQMNKAENLFQITPAAECKRTKVKLESTALSLGETEEGVHNSSRATQDSHGHDHGDISIEVVFTCAKVRTAQYIDIKLFDVYIRLKNIDAQVVSSHGQFKHTLRPGTARLNIAN